MVMRVVNDPPRPNRPILEISSIPTLTELYHQVDSGTTPPNHIPSSVPFDAPPLHPVIYRDPSRIPSASINDRISLHQGSITDLRIDAIVNSSQTNLRPNGGVDSAIHGAAGHYLIYELASYEQGCSTGACVVTRGYNLPARYVIHTVGPVYQARVRNGGGATSRDATEDLLRSCYRTALAAALEYGIKTIAFCCVSAGVSGYPHSRAASVACSEVRRFLEQHGENEMERVIFCVYENDDARAYERIMPRYFPPAEEKMA